jgi:hypothetical protein
MTLVCSQCFNEGLYYFEKDDLIVQLWESGGCRLTETDIKEQIQKFAKNLRKTERIQELFKLWKVDFKERAFQSSPRFQTATIFAKRQQLIQQSLSFPTTLCNLTSEYANDFRFLFLITEKVYLEDSDYPRRENLYCLEQDQDISSIPVHFGEWMYGFRWFPYLNRQSFWCKQCILRKIPKLGWPDMPHLRKPVTQWECLQDDQLFSSIDNDKFEEYLNRWLRL